MTEVGDYVRIKIYKNLFKNKIGIVEGKYPPLTYYQKTAYYIKIINTNERHIFYRKEFKQISKDEAMVETL